MVDQPVVVIIDLVDIRELKVGRGGEGREVTLLFALCTLYRRGLIQHTTTHNLSGSYACFGTTQTRDRKGFEIFWDALDHKCLTDMQLHGGFNHDSRSESFLSSLPNSSRFGHVLLLLLLLLLMRLRLLLSDDSRCMLCCACTSIILPIVTRCHALSNPTPSAHLPWSVPPPRNSAQSESRVEIPIAQSLNLDKLSWPSTCFRHSNTKLDNRPSRGCSSVSHRA